MGLGKREIIMGTLTYTQMKDRLRFMHGMRLDFSSPIDYYGQWISTSYLTLTTANRLYSIQRNFYFPELETDTSASPYTPTVAHQAYVSVPSDCLIIRQIHNLTSDALLTATTWYLYMKATGRASTYAKPTQWIRRGTKIFLLPTPDAVYNLNVSYRKRPDALSDASDTTEIGAEWDEPIIKLAYIQSLERLGEYEKAELEKKDFSELVTNMLGVYDQEEKARRDYLVPDYLYRAQGEY